MLVRPLLLLPSLGVLLIAHSVQPIIILGSTPTAATTATTGTTTGTTTTTTGTVGALGTLGTLTLGTTTLGTGLASLGVLGALKLGVIAIAAKLAALAGFALAKKLHYKEPSEYNSYSEYDPYGHHYVPVYTGHGGGYGSHGGGYGSSHYHRKRRDVQDESQQQFEQTLVLGEEEAFAIVHESDESRCGERLVCELARGSKRGLQSDEQSILGLLQQSPTGPHFGPKRSSRRLYLNAMKAGYRGRSCRVLYATCPFNSDQMMALVRSMGRDLVHEPISFLESQPDQQTLHPGVQITPVNKVHKGVVEVQPLWGLAKRPMKNQQGLEGPYFNSRMQNFIPGSLDSSGWKPMSGRKEARPLKLRTQNAADLRQFPQGQEVHDQQPLMAAFDHIGFRKQ